MNKMLMRIGFILCLLVLLGSCERRPLVEYGGRVKIRVILNVKEIPNVTAGIYNEKVVVPLTKPETFRVIFYDQDTKQSASQAFISRQGVDENGYDYYEGYVFVNPGTYDLVCYNFDTPSTLVRKENDKNTIEAFTSEISEQLYSRFKTRADGPSPTIYYEPDHLFVACEDGITVHETDEIVTITTQASTIVDTYYVQVRLVNGKYASNAVAMLTDLAPSNRFGVGEPKYDEYAGTYFEMYRSVDIRQRTSEQDVLCAVFNTFGKRPDHIDPTVESQLFLSFSILTSDGKSVEMSLDMDSIFQTVDARERHWLLIDKEIVLPKPEVAGGGFTPTVDGWDEETGEIVLGNN